jgi:hypothetical protein
VSHLQPWVVSWRELRDEDTRLEGYRYQKHFRTRRAAVAYAHELRKNTCYVFGPTSIVLSFNRCGGHVALIQYHRSPIKRPGYTMLKRVKCWSSRWGLEIG